LNRINGKMPGITCNRENEVVSAAIGFRLDGVSVVAVDNLLLSDVGRENLVVWCAGDGLGQSDEAVVEARDATAKLHLSADWNQSRVDAETGDDAAACRITCALTCKGATSISHNRCDQK